MTPIRPLYRCLFSSTAFPRQHLRANYLNRRFVRNTSLTDTDTLDLEESINDQTDVSFKLTKDVFSRTVKGNQNLVFSPLSIQLVLGLIASGSKGPTQDQILSFLKANSIDDLNSIYSHIASNVFVDGSPSGGPLLSIANGAWVDRKCRFKTSFEHIVYNVYNAALSSLDFQNKVEVVNQVNDWAKKKTNGLIKDILPHGAVDHMTKLLLANALYFKGSWLEWFNASKTKDHEFHLLSGGSVRAPFMTSNKDQYIAAYQGFKVLWLPYKSGMDTRQFSMHIILPDAVDGFPALVDKISSEPGFLDEHLQYNKVKVRNFLIPKFKITFGFEASDTLKRLGLTLPFTNDSLTEMVDSPLFLSEVFHKSFIEVNEKGTEAAAVTAVMVGSSCYEIIRKKEDFVADHPFLFLIRERLTGVVLFVGSVLNPIAVSA